MKLRNKARNLRKNTIEAYLEAKKIKNQYMLDIMEDSDDDFESFTN